MGQEMKQGKQIRPLPYWQLFPVQMSGFRKETLLLQIRLSFFLLLQSVTLPDFQSLLYPHPAIPYYVYKFFILCELKGGSFTETFDILGKGFFRLEELPPLSLERVLPEQIQRMYAYYKHPGEDVYLD